MKSCIIFFLIFFQTTFSQSHKSLVCNGSSSSMGGLYVVGKIFVVPGPPAEEKLLKPNKSATICIYPNPVMSELIIDSNEKIKSFSIYSAEGKLVTQGVLTNANKVDLSNLIKGYYFIVFDDDYSKTFKLLKN